MAARSLLLVVLGLAALHSSTAILGSGGGSDFFGDLKRTMEQLADIPQLLSSREVLGALKDIDDVVASLPPPLNLDTNLHLLEDDLSRLLVQVADILRTTDLRDLQFILGGMNQMCGSSCGFHTFDVQAMIDSKCARAHVNGEQALKMCELEAILEGLISHNDNNLVSTVLEALHALLNGVIHLPGSCSGFDPMGDFSSFEHSWKKK